jgi:hypothetical protein
MLCMRPVKCRGLPIFLLHPVFAKYLSLGKKALPPTQEAEISLQVARTLCNTMGDYFETEKDRKEAFLRAIRPLLSRWVMGISEGATAATGSDMTVSIQGVTMLLNEIKNTKQGDPYMQASRGYEIATEALTKTHPNVSGRGAPAFLACLNG